MIKFFSNVMRWFTVLFWFMVFFAIPALAEVADQKKELTRIQAEITTVAGTLERIEKEQGELMVQLAEIEKHYGKTVAALNTVQKQIARKQQRLQELRQESETLQSAIKEQNKGLGGQIKAAFAMGRKEKLKLLLNQQEPSVSSRMMVYYDYLNNERLGKMTRIGQALQRVAELELEKRQETEHLAEQLGLVRQEQAELAKTRVQRKALLARLGKEYSSSKAQLSQLKEGEKRLQKLLQDLQQTVIGQFFEPGPAKPFVKLQGHLPWPVNGKVVKKFGSPRLESRWDGVLIAATEGAEIRAVSEGKVVFADWFRGYGLLTIIDHGKDFMTLYAFSQSLYKRVGDHVEPGDIIATVGKSGGRNNAGLYFGIRRKGKPIDPVRWCRKIDRDQIG